MKKKKKVLLIVLICFLALILISGAIALYYFGPMLAMKPAPTAVIEETGITVVQDDGNDIYLIDTDDCLEK